MYLPLNKMDDYFYMVTFKIRTYGRNINRLTPFMDIVYFLCIPLHTRLLYITPRNINLPLSGFELANQ